MKILNPECLMQIACILEVTARKPGNVNRLYDFEDAGYLDFILSAMASAGALDRLDFPLGQKVLWIVNNTRLVVDTNTNLGIALLIVPLSIACMLSLERAGPFGEQRGPLRVHLKKVLANTTVEDSQKVYEAIRRALPAGLGKVGEQDIRKEPTLPLRDVMALAADHDLIARQYVNDYQQVFEEGLPALQRALKAAGCLETAIITCHLELLAQHPDSLIARKCGSAVAIEASRRAQIVLEAGSPVSPVNNQPLADFDVWLRADGHRRNPGTTADLVTACLFVALWEDTITLPLSFPRLTGASHGRTL